MNSVLIQPYNEYTLVHSLRSGNRKAFDELYERFSPSLMKIITRIVLDEKQSEDLLQDSFIKIWCSLDTYDPAKGRLYTWMLTITRNTALRYLQRPKYMYCHIEDIPFGMAGFTTPLYQTIGLIDWVSSTLSGHELVVIKLMYFQGYNFQEISDETRLPLGSVKTYVRRGLQQLRDNLYRTYAKGENG